jgi:DNA mismatch endonuclease (patch repair protein)
MKRFGSIAFFDGAIDVSVGIDEVGGHATCICAYFPSNRCVDPLSPEERSRRMSKIRSSGNKNTELRLVSIFRNFGITGWRRRSRLIGKPDFVFPEHRLVIFVDGCFWHGCGKHCRLPKSRREFWLPKIERNRKRDAKVCRFLRKNGWGYVRIWEHALGNPEKVAKRVRTALQKSRFNDAKH